MKINKYIALAALALSFAACTQEDIVPQGQEIRIASVSVNQPITRSGGTAYEGTLGMYVTNGKNTYSNVNCSYIAGQWDIDGVLYHDGYGSQQQTGVYAPYIENVPEDKNLVISTPADQSETPCTDYLYSDYQALTSHVVSFEMRHLLSKVVLEVHWGSEYDSNPVKKIQLLDLYDKGTWTVPTPSLDVDGESSADITAKQKDTGSNLYQALVMPFTYNDGVTLGITTTDDRYFEATVMPVAEIPFFEMGCGYTFQVKVGKDVLTIEQVSMGDFDSPFGDGWNNEEDLN